MAVELRNQDERSTIKTMDSLMITRKNSTNQAKLAYLNLPQEFQREILLMGFKYCRIEQSGALSFKISSETSISEKKSAIEKFRASSNQYGLDIQRISPSLGSGSLCDDGFLLVHKMSTVGGRPRLFEKDGSLGVIDSADCNKSNNSKSKYPT